MHIIVYVPTLVGWARFESRSEILILTLFIDLLTLYIEKAFLPMPSCHCPPAKYQESNIMRHTYAYSCMIEI